MSIAVLTQVYDETRRLAIAGSNLASGDFRLKKLVPPLEAAAAKAPVFGKVAEAINRLVESDTKTSADALLELNTLVSAVLYTQGETGVAGELTPIESSDFGLPTSNASARLLKPLIEALTTTGSGREEMIKDAHQRGAFKDLRLVRLAVAAIDDPYAPIADYIADNVLPLYGKAIYEDLRTTYNPKAKGGQVRRLHLMHKLDPEQTHELVEQALEAGSADMKVAAIECLAGKEESLSYLLEQAKAKSSDVRRAALKALATFDNEEVLATLIKALSGNDLAIAAEPASQNRSPKLLAFLLEQTEKELRELLALKDKEKLKKATTHFYNLLLCFAGRDDRQSLALLGKLFDQREAIGALKGETDGQDINRRIASLMIKSGDKSALKQITDAHATLSSEVLDRAILAAVLTRKPKEVYDLFAPYYTAATEKKKKSDASSQKRDVLRQVLTYLSEGRRHAYGYRYFGYDLDAIELGEQAKSIELDPRWLEAAVATSDTDMVLNLARPKHKPTHDYLSKVLGEMLAKKGDLDYQAWQVMETILRVEHPQAVEHFMAALNKAAGKKQHYYSYWLVRLVPMLPKSAAPQIEALLPSMHEKLVDQIAPYLAELQAKTE